jgi:hypothetical protein
LTVHSNVSIDVSRSRRIVLKAVVTTKASSAIMQDATDARASTQAFPAFSLDSDMIFSSRRVG